MDYAYNFATEARHAVNFQDKSFSWPELNKHVDTVLLRLKITKNSWSKFVRPYIEIKAGNTCERQYFERDCLGVCYVNVTALLQQVPGQKISISSKVLQWQQQAELLTFTNQIKPKAKVLVIAPHPDDAELAAFGFYSDHASHIVNVTVGETGRIDYARKHFSDPKEQRLFKAKVRILDSIMTPLWGGVRPNKAVNLGYFSSTLRDMYVNPDKPIVSPFAQDADIIKWRKFNIATLPKSDGMASWNNLVNDLKMLIAKIQPDILVLPHPILDKNPDHCLCAQAVFMAMQELKLNRGEFLFYVTHSILSAKYPYGSQHSTVNIPPNFTDTLAYTVYSHALTKNKQIDKLFALNNMHDIAPTPGGDSMWQQLYNKLFGKSKYYQPWRKYFRRAVRANEIFLALPFTLRQKLFELTAAKLRQKSVLE